MDQPLREGQFLFLRFFKERNSSRGKIRRSEEVIPEILSPNDFERRAKAGIEVASKLVPGRTYLLRWKRKLAVLENGKTVGYLCVRPYSECDIFAEHLSLYLNLVLNERRLLAVANLISDRSQSLHQGLLDTILDS